MSDTLAHINKINLEFEKAFTSAAVASRKMGFLDESLLGAKRVLSYNPHSVVIMNLFPEFEQIIDEITKLADSYGSQLNVNPQDPVVWSKLGFCYLTLGDFPNAFASLAHGMKSLSTDGQNDANFWYAMGIVYAHYKYLPHSRSCFKRVFALDPDFIFKDDINFRLGLTYHLSQKYEKAINTFNKVLDSPPNGLNRDDILMQIANSWQMKGMNNKARNIYENIYQKYPNSLEFLQQYCLFLFLQCKGTDFTPVQDILNYSIKKYPNDTTFSLILARMAMRVNDIVSAYQHFKYCIEFYTESPAFWCVLGILYYKNDQSDESLIAFKKSLNLKSDMLESILNIGLIYEEKLDFQSAQQVYAAAKQKISDVPILSERLLSVTNHQRSKSFRTQSQIMDIDDSKFIPSPVEQFTTDYISSVPKLPCECFCIGESAKAFSKLATYPKSFFT